LHACKLGFDTAKGGFGGAGDFGVWFGIDIGKGNRKACALPRARPSPLLRRGNKCRIWQIRNTAHAAQLPEKWAAAVHIWAEFW